MNATKHTQFSVDSLFTSYQVGALLQVNPSSVNKWVKDGRIPAYRTPGGHRRIRAADLVSFLTEHKMPIPPTLSTASRRRVLIAESDVRHLEALQASAKNFVDRLDVICVGNGVDAMVHVGAIRPHVILWDAHMPNFDCLDVCRRLKDGNDTRQIHIILATHQLNADLHRQALAAGAVACVAKPIDFGVLLHALGLGLSGQVAAL